MTQTEASPLSGSILLGIRNSLFQHNLLGTDEKSGIKSKSDSTKLKFEKSTSQ